ncbi:MAG: C39 family peptidase [Nocardioidaceae bacterium]|nr:C39 family peptidase [Nocardioidaceae bacterium]
MSSDISFRAWRTDELGGGTHVGTEPTDRGLRMAEPVGTRRYTDPHADVRSDQQTRLTEWSAWVGPAVEPGHAFDRLVPSWNARTPDGSWIELEARVSVDGLGWSRWHSFGCWAETDAEIHRTSRSGQSVDGSTVRVDVLSARPGLTWTAYQLRLALHRRVGSTAVPEVSLVGAVVSTGPADPVGEIDPGGAAHGIELSVPAYSQQIHRGEYPQWGGGGEAWCSPTATSMVLRHWGLGPSEKDCAWVDPGYADRFVDHAAWHVFDYAYGGAGNWSFNAAYAARYGAEAFVTQLRSLAEAELFIAAGIPLVASVSFTADELDGAGYDTAGHLLTIIGFTDDGRVICNDPASHELPSNDEVRVVFDRAQFERTWVIGGGGIVYVVRPHGHPLPELPDPPEPHRAPEPDHRTG